MKKIMSWNDFEKACGLIVKKLKGYNLNTVYGIPRGGLPLAVRLSHLMELDLIIDERKITSSTLIADDIADTGKTLYPWRGHVIATLYYHKQSIVIPTVWIYEKKDAWVIFPWERK